MLIVFFFNDTATTEIYTLSLHDALPIYPDRAAGRHAGVGGRELSLRQEGAGRPRDAALALGVRDPGRAAGRSRRGDRLVQDRKSTRLNSSHANISYAVFCLKKKKSQPIE